MAPATNLILCPLVKEWVVFPQVTSVLRMSLVSSRREAWGSSPRLSQTPTFTGHVEEGPCLPPSLLCREGHAQLVTGDGVAGASGSVSRATGTWRFSTV